MPTILTAKQNRFKDFDLPFIAHPITGDISVLTGEESIKKSVRNLILLRFYEKPFHPEIGSEVYGLLFENFTPILKINLENAIRKTLNDYEPRVELLDVYIELMQDTNNIDIKITFQIVNQLQPIVIDVILEINR